MNDLYIIKTGGNIIDDEEKLKFFLQKFALLKGKKILVHGGGKLATRMAEQLHIPQKLVDGRRITDAETLKIVTMVYAGYINKNIVALLQSMQCNAAGICGADGNSILAHKRKKGSVDFGFAGDIDRINTSWIEKLLEAGTTLVVAPITHDAKGQLLNTNADTIAQELAKALCKTYHTQLVYCFEKRGVLMNAEDESTLIPTLSAKQYNGLKASQKIFAGMIPKLDNAFAALQNGVARVIIGKAEALENLIAGKDGTIISNE